MDRHFYCKFFVVLIVAFASQVQLLAQIGISPEKSALSSLHKQKWDKVESSLAKSIRKDSVNATARYVYALYFLDANSPRHQTDSAHFYCTNALKDYTAATIKQRERMKKFPLDSTIIFKLYEKIDSTAFAEAKHLNTEASYIHFLTAYPQTSSKAQAVELRDQIAYMDALRENTYEAFYKYLSKYPTASQAQEAQRRYDKLLFESKTHDKRLVSYENFLNEYPKTPYRHELEKEIFEIITAGGTASSFELFISRHPESAFVTIAKELLFHILSEHDLALPSFLASDSTREVSRLAHAYLVPFLKNGKFGFIDNNGNIVIPPITPDLDKNYLCGNVTEDVLVFPDRVITKNGTTIFEGMVDELSDLGYGFLKIETKDDIKVIHKSGITLPYPSMDDVKLLAGKFLAFKAKAKWALYSLGGRKLTEYEWDNISAIDDVILLHEGTKIKLATAEQIGLLADQQKLKTHDWFDDVKPWTDGLIWTRTNDFEGILDQSLTAVIPYEKQSLTSSFFGAVGSSPKGKKLFIKNTSLVEQFNAIQVSKPWVAVKQSKSWRLYNPLEKKYQSAAFDSISFVGPFAVGHASDTVDVYFKPDKFIELVKSRLEFIPGKDSVTFVLTDDGDKKAVYNSKGNKLFTGQYDKIQYAGHGIFVVVKKEKKGLVGADGKMLLPIEYDAIGSYSNGVISLLKSMKFGLYHVAKRKQIKPQYDKNIVHYNTNWSVAFANGLYGFIDWDEKTKDKFEFEEIREWNDSIAWVKKNFQWSLYNFVSLKTRLEKVKDYKIVSDIKGEKVAIIHQENKYGVINNKTGTILPSTYSDIKNLGSAEEPLYFTEKQVEEASLFVVIYYDKRAKLLQRFVYEVEDYERVYCADN